MLANFIKGLQLLLDKQRDPEWDDISAEYDMVTVPVKSLASFTAEEVRTLHGFGFYPGLDGDYCNMEDILEEKGLGLPEGEYFEWEELTTEQWEAIKDMGDDYFTYYA